MEYMNVLLREIYLLPISTTLHGSSLPSKTCKNLDANTMIALFDGADTIIRRAILPSSVAFDSSMHCVRSETKNVVLPVPRSHNEAMKMMKKDSGTRTLCTLCREH